MKRRIYFLISSICQIFLSIYMILNADKYIKMLLEAANMYSGDMRERLISLCENSGQLYVGIMYGIIILLNMFIIYYACRNILLKKKRGIIITGIVTFLLASNSIIQLLAVLNIIIIAFSKRVNPEDFPDKVEEMPKLAKEKVDTKKIILAVILSGIYFSQFIWGDFLPKNKSITILVSLVFYIMMIILSICFFNDLFKECFNTFTKHFKSYVHHLTPDLGKFILIYFGAAFLTTLITRGETAANQNTVEALPIFLSAPLAIIYAPIVEETLFRGCIRRFISNDKIFVIVSGIIFGLLHTFSSEVGVYNIIIHAIPYAVLGGCLAYMYKKTNNICTNITFHALFNTFGVIMMILINGVK